jgi:hypothetical protein
MRAWPKPQGTGAVYPFSATGPAQHRLLAEHLTSEYRVRTEGRGRTVDEWKLRPERPDNHWLDCLVGCAVAASMDGAVLPGTAAGTHARAGAVCGREGAVVGSVKRRRCGLRGNA